MNRYQELKQENNSIVKYLGDQYQLFANKLVKRVRKFAVKSVDTEIRLNEELKELKEKEEKGININSFIPNHEVEIENRITKYSKRYVDKDQIKGIIILSIIIVITLSWLIVSKYLSRTPTLNNVENLYVTIYETKAKVTYSEVNFAETYHIYYTYIDSDIEKKSSEYTTTDTTIMINIEKNRTYTFYVYATSSNNINPSKPVSFTVEA